MDEQKSETQVQNPSTTETLVSAAPQATAPMETSPVQPAASGATTTPSAAQPDDGPDSEHQSMPIVEPGSVEEQMKGALRQIYDPEIGLEVIQLGLIREINLKSDPAEVKMMLTTPFCPYGGWLIQQIKDVSESIAGKPIKVIVLPDLWDPNLMEDPGLLMGW
ncbi:MAG: iron-sulfur cluster assembly protein [Anaerolineae bacterium]